MDTIFVIMRPDGTPFHRDDAMGILATDSEAQAIRLQHAREDEGAEYVRYTRAQPPSAASVSERARALMAQAYRDGGFPHAAGTLEAGVIDSVDSCALSAIEQALTQQREDEPAAWMVEWTDNAGDPTRYIAYCEEDAADKLGVLSDGEAATAKVVPLYTTSQPSAA